MGSEESRLEQAEQAEIVANNNLLIVPFRSTPKTSKLLVVSIFSTGMTSRESITIRASASLEMILTCTCTCAWLSFAPSRNGLFVVGSRWDLTVGIRPFDHLTRLLMTFFADL